jgi:hypothetical protein
MAEEDFFRSQMESTEHTCGSATLTAVSRRSVLHLAGAVGAGGLLSTSAASADNENDDRTGETIEGEIVSGEQEGTDLANTIGTSAVQDQVISATFRGATEQATTFSQSLQGLPTSGTEFIVLSSGVAQDAPGDPETFANTDIANGRSNQDYSPDGYDAFNIADLEITITVPDDAEGIAFDYKFGTEENPSWLDSEYQDFFEVQLYDPDGGVQNLALIDGEPVTVSNADTLANSPEGSSQDPAPPFPSPEDVVYNSVTELQTVTHDVSDYQGQTISLVFRIADASDGFLDSAAFIDNLRFTNQVDTDPTPVQNALENYEQSFKQHIERQFEAQAQFIARLYNEHGNEFGSQLTDYWGYQSGNLSASEISDGVREISDSTIDTVIQDGNMEINETDAQILYDFYGDLFSTVSESDSLDQLIQTTTQYFLGTHPDQSNYIAFDDGQTVAEGLNEDWGLATDVYDQFTNQTDPTQADLQRVTNGIDTRAKRLATRGKEDIESKRKAAKALIETEESESAEIHAQRLEKPTSGQEVEGEIAASTAAMIIILAAGAGGLAAGYVVNKCAGAYTAAHSAEGVEFNAVTLTRPDKAIIGTVNSVLNLGAGITNYGQYFTEGTTESQTVASSLFTANFIAGQKAAAADLALQTAAIFSQASLAQQVDAEITTLDLPDVTETKQMGLLGSFVNNIKTALDDLLGGWYDYSPPQIGTATGSVTISTSNPVGDTPITFEPVFGSDYKLFDGDEPIGSSYPFKIKGDMSTMETGEERTFDIEYETPLDQGVLSGEGQIEFGVSPVSETPVSGKTDLLPLGLCELDYTAMEKASATGQFSANTAAQNKTIGEDLAEEGTTNTYTYTPDPGTNQALITLNYKNHYSDLHLYDSQNNEVGYDYTANTTISEIDGATYSGRDTGDENSEWISFPVSDDEYTIEVVTPEVGTVGQGTITGKQTASLTSEYQTDATEVGDLPPELSVTPSTLLLTEEIQPGDTLDLSLALEEVNGEQAAENVTVTASDLTRTSGDTIAASRITFETNGQTVSGPTTYPYTIDIPDDTALGTYSGTLNISSTNADSITVNVGVQVSGTQTGPSVVGDSPTQDLDGDNLYEDINGDSEVDIADVNALLQNRESTAVQTNVDQFDFNNDGKIDIVDVNQLLKLIQQ